MPNKIIITLCSGINHALCIVPNCLSLNKRRAHHEVRSYCQSRASNAASKNSNCQSKIELHLSAQMITSYKHPLAPSLDKFIQKHPDVRQDEPADVETEEFSGMTCTKFKTNLRFISVSKTRVFYLTCDLIYIN